MTMLTSLKSIPIKLRWILPREISEVFSFTSKAKNGFPDPGALWVVTKDLELSVEDTQIVKFLLIVIVSSTK